MKTHPLRYGECSLSITFLLLSLKWNHFHETADQIFTKKSFRVFVSETVVELVCVSSPFALKYSHPKNTCLGIPFLEFSNFSHDQKIESFRYFSWITLSCGKIWKLGRKPNPHQPRTLLHTLKSLIGTCAKLKKVNPKTVFSCTFFCHFSFTPFL